MTTDEIRAAIRGRGGLANQSDIARLLGVSSARVGAIRAAHADFPEPLDSIGPDNRPVWIVDDVREWHQRRRRRLQKRRQRGSPGAAKLKTTP